MLQWNSMRYFPRVKQAICSRPKHSQCPMHSQFQSSCKHNHFDQKQFNKTRNEHARIYCSCPFSCFPARQSQKLGISKQWMLLIAPKVEQTDQEESDGEEGRRLRRTPSQHIDSQKYECHTVVVAVAVVPIEKADSDTAACQHCVIPHVGSGDWGLGTGDGGLVTGDCVAQWLVTVPPAI